MFRVMIVEDDPSTGALLVRLVKRVSAQSSVVLVADAPAALDHWKNLGADLVLLDLVLPGISGMEVLKQIRRADKGTICIMISGQADRDAILAARLLRVDDFIAKPFDAGQMMARLAQIIPDATGAGPAPAEPEALHDFVERQLGHDDLGLPIDPDLVEAVTRIRIQDREEQGRLLRRCQVDPAIVLRALGLANTGHYNRGGDVIATFEGALRQIGIDGLVNVTLEQSLHPGSHLTAEPLADLRQTYLRESMSLLGLVSKLRQHVDFDAGACRTAALLYHAAELSLLELVQAWADGGGWLDASACTAILDGFGARANERLLSQWGLPNVIRERIAAVGTPPSGVVKKECLVMRIAGLLHQGGQDAELPRLMARLGLGGGILGPDQHLGIATLERAEPPTRVIR